MERAKGNLIMGNIKKVEDSEAHDDVHQWPPKNYNCSFCKREFRSAQALGGHMNVHRRDRARLRLLPRPWPPLDYRNPNPSFDSSSSSSSRPKSLVSSSPSHVNSLPSSQYSSSGFTNEEKKRLLECTQQNALKTPSEGLRKKKKKKKNMRAAFGAGKLKELAISLDLEMGLKDSNEDVDLELRLGYR